MAVLSIVMTSAIMPTRYGSAPAASRTPLIAAGAQLCPLPSSVATHSGRVVSNT